MTFFMDLSFLDKSSGVTPLLVRLYDSHKLYGLAKDKKPLARAELMSVVSDLLGMDLSPRESELIADVLIALMRQAETDLRKALAERLSMLGKAPLRLILQLSHDEIEIAAPVLRNSNVLGELDLIYIIKSKSAEYWREIAARKKLSDHVMNILADTRDFTTAMTLAENTYISLTEHTLGVLSELAQNSEDIAMPLLRRDDIGSEIASKLYQFVGYELKRYIADNYEIESGKITDVIDEIVLEFVDVAEEDQFGPTPSTVKAVERYHEKGILTVKMMLATLKRGQMQTFIAMYSKFSGLPVDTVISILRQSSGQGLAVACRAKAIAKQDFISMYLLSNRIRNSGKMVDLKDITRAIAYFDRIQSDVAKGILENSLNSLQD
ncbi:MAG: DUF2336 domain-containing protein [Alphaproteobacteria bacterium]